MSLGRDIKLTVICSAAQALLSLATGIASARLLGPEGRGEFYLLVQSASLITTALAFGLGSSYQYHLSACLLSAEAVARHAQLHLALTGVALAAVLIYAPGLVVAATGSFLSGLNLTILGLAAWIGVAQLFAASIHIGAKASLSYNSILGVIASGIYLAAFLALCGFAEMGVIGGGLSLLIGLMIRLVPVSGMLLVQESQPSHWLGRLRASPGLYGYAISSFASNLSVMLSLRITIFFTSTLCGARELGVYSIALAFTDMALLVPNAVGTALFAHLPGMTADERRSATSRAARALTAIALLIAAAMACICHPLIVLLMGSEYEGAIMPLCLLLLGMITMSINYALANHFASSGRPLHCALSFGCGSVLSVPLHLCLTPRYGIEGAAIATSVSYAFITIVFLLMFTRDGGSLRGVIPGWRDYRDLIRQGARVLAMRIQ